MTEPGNTSGTENKESSIDLSSLLNAGAFGPSWASGKQSSQNYKDHQNLDDEKSDRRRKGGGKPRDRRQGMRQGGDRRPERSSGGRGPGQGERQGDHRQGERRPPRHRNQQIPYRPDFDIQLQPHPTAFAALLKAMRESCRTFELFEISRLFLSKSDRFIAKVLPKGTNPGKPNPKEDPKPESADSEQIFYISEPDGVGFENEAEAIDHVLGNHLDKFFEIAKVEKEPPKGTFNVVNRCTVTNTLLAPPNYHRYQHILQEHYASKIHAMSFERFESKIETVREQEAVDQWLEAMKTGYLYKAKDTGQEFQHLEDARRHLLMHHKAKVVRTANTIRIDGKDLEKLPKNRIRRSIEAVLEKQLKVPLDFSNHLRGRLRRANFTIYKRGGKGGVTYVCAVKRQNRTPDTAFSDSIQHLVDFIEMNPEVTAQRILKSLLPVEGSVELETQESEATTLSEPEQTNTTAVTSEETDLTPETTSPMEANPEDAQTTEVEATSEGVNQDEGEETPKPEATKDEEVSPKSNLTPRQKKPQVTEPKEEKPLVGDIPVSATLAQDLRWLVQYGYVTEYSDGRLFAPPVKIEPLNVAAAKRPGKELENENTVVDSVTEATIVEENSPDSAEPSMEPPTEETQEPLRGDPEDAPGPEANVKLTAERSLEDEGEQSIEEEIAEHPETPESASEQVSDDQPPTDDETDASKGL